MENKSLDHIKSERITECYLDIKIEEHSVGEGPSIADYPPDITPRNSTNQSRIEADYKQI